VSIRLTAQTQLDPEAGPLVACAPCSMAYCGSYQLFDIRVIDRNAVPAIPAGRLPSPSPRQPQGPGEPPACALPNRPCSKADACRCTWALRCWLAADSSASSPPAAAASWLRQAWKISGMLSCRTGSDLQQHTPTGSHRATQQTGSADVRVRLSQQACTLMWSCDKHCTAIAHVLLRLCKQAVTLKGPISVCCCPAQMSW
jgi:hypothetical protein